jgi:hypothetical protein
MDDGKDPSAELDAAATARTDVRWTRSEDGDGWRAASADDSEEAHVRVTGSTFEAKVYLRPTGPGSGPDQKLAHGPSVFDDADEALQYCEERISP